MFLYFFFVFFSYNIYFYNRTCLQFSTIVRGTCDFQLLFTNKMYILVNQVTQSKEIKKKNNIKRHEYDVATCSTVKKRIMVRVLWRFFPTHLYFCCTLGCFASLNFCANFCANFWRDYLSVFVLISAHVVHIPMVGIVPKQQEITFCSVTKKKLVRLFVLTPRNQIFLIPSSPFTLNEISYTYINF